MGHQNYNKLQLSLTKSHRKNRYAHGGTLRNQRSGRKSRALSTKSAIHLVFKVDKSKIRRGLRSPLGFKICPCTIKKYSKRFFVKIEQLAICGDHIHALIRITKRSFGQYFFRVVAGQIAQEFKKHGFWVTGTQSIWKHRPFTRIVFGQKAFETAKNYVRLNEKEAQGQIPYRKERLRELKPEEWKILWM